jgi:agmatine/peptidylarginine deiminase
MHRRRVRRDSAMSFSESSVHATVEALECRWLLSGSSDEQPVLPRNLTPAEIEYLKNHPLGSEPGLAAPTPPPSGPIDPVAEYEPMEGLVISWMGFTNILRDITKRVTDAGGRVYVNIDNPPPAGFTLADATASLQSAGVNMSNVTFRHVNVNSVWARDYGPRYVYEGDVRVITDHQYNRPRPNDDLQPNDFAALKQHKYYEIGLNGTTLIHGGGNYHLNGAGDAYATVLIDNENSFNQTQIRQIWDTYENNTTEITGAFPQSVDSTQHIDMWMQIYDDNKVFISDWPNAQGSAQDIVCETTATLMQSRGYQVTRLPAYRTNAHYTFTNMVIFNDIVILPQYNNGPGAVVSNQVLAQVQAAMPDKTVFQLNGDPIVTSAGVFHCVVQHIPRHLGLTGTNGGLAPTAYLRGPNNGETLQGGQQYQIEWTTDDDAPVAASGGVTGVDILLSTDGGQTFPTVIASNQPALGSFNWTVPNIDTSQARIRVVARDGVNNTGHDDSDTNFTIGIPVANGTWDGGGDGVSWSDANNWSNNTLPGASDDVVIATNGTFTVNVTGALTNVKSLSLGGASSNPTLSISAGGNKLLKTGSIVLNGASNLDLHDNDLIIDYTGASHLAAIQGLINSARNGGDWLGNGITSSAARTHPSLITTLGAMEATDYDSIHGAGALFNGLDPDDTAVLVKYTYYADTDFNGAIDGDDYSRMDSGFNSSFTGWMNGDADGNGVVDGDDYSLIDLAFNLQGAVL